MSGARSRTPVTAPIGPGDWPLIGARRHSGAPCLVTDDGVAMSYAELESASSRPGTALLAAGLRPGDRVTILATDSMQYAALLFAAFKAGLISVPLNFRLRAAELTELIAIAAPAALFTEARYLPMLPTLTAAAGPQLALTATLDESPGCAATYASLVSAASPDAYVTSSTWADDVVMWLLTSGTTGTPRVVMQSQRAIKGNTAKGIIEQCFGPEDCLYAGTPLFHVAGMGWLFYAVSRGASLFVLPQFNADWLLPALQDGRVTRCLLVPSMAIALLDHPDVGRSDYSHLTSIAYGGRPCRPRSSGGSMRPSGAICTTLSAPEPRQAARRFCGQPTTAPRSPGSRTCWARSARRSTASTSSCAIPTGGRWDLARSVRSTRAAMRS